MEKKDEKIEIIDVYAEHVYANLVSFNVNPEEICLGMGIRDVKDLTRVKPFVNIPSNFWTLLVVQIGDLHTLNAGIGNGE